MNNILRIFGRYRRQLQVAALYVANWEKGQFQAITDALTVLLSFDAIMMIIALVIGRISTVSGESASNNGTVFADFLISIVGIFSGFMSLYLMVRIGVVTTLSKRLADTLGAIIKIASRPLPGPPIDIPTLVKQEDIDRLMKLIAAGFACLTGGCGYAAVFPIYTNLTGFFVTITLIFFMVTMIFAFDMPVKFPVKDWLVMGAFMLVCLNSAVLIIPGLGEYLRFRVDSQSRSWKDSKELRQAQETADRKAKGSSVKAIAAIQLKRDILQQKLEQVGSLDPNEKKIFQSYTNQINDLAAGKLLETSGSESGKYYHDPRNATSKLSMTWPLWVLLVCVLFAVFNGKIKTEEKSSHGHH